MPVYRFIHDDWGDWVFESGLTGYEVLGVRVAGGSGVPGVESRDWLDIILFVDTTKEDLEVETSHGRVRIVKRGWLEDQEVHLPETIRVKEVKPKITSKTQSPHPSP